MQKLSIFEAYRNKIAVKLGKPVTVRALGAKKGAILLSYLSSPFTLTPKERKTDPHTSYAECIKIAELFSKRGYDVDVIDWDNTTFIPKKPYKVCIDIQKNLERLEHLLPRDCKRVMHIVSAYSEFQNEAEAKRLRRIKSRRDIQLIPRRQEYVSLNPKYANFLEGFGNKTIQATYARFGKSIFPIPASVAHEFSFPDSKDFEKVKKTFMWFGGGGAVHKGLDLVLEAFSRMPGTKLHIIGPITKERDFIDAFANELSSPDLILHDRPKVNAQGHMIVGNQLFSDIANECVAIIYPSCSEGTSGAVIQAMHASLIPVITPETGIAEDAPAIVLKETSVESIQAEMQKMMNTSDDVLRSKAYDVWSYVRKHNTMEKFEEAYTQFIDTKLEL